MQTQTSVKRFALNHIGGTALAFGILVSSVTAAATLSVTGDSPGRGHAESARVATSELPARVTAAVAEQRQLQMERNDFEAWRVQTASVVATDAVNAAWEQMAALVEAKQAQLEANQLHASQTVAQAVAEQRQLRMDRADFLTGHR